MNPRPMFYLGWTRLSELPIYVATFYVPGGDQDETIQLRISLN